MDTQRLEDGNLAGVRSGDITAHEYVLTMLEQYGNDDSHARLLAHAITVLDHEPHHTTSTWVRDVIRMLQAFRKLVGRDREAATAAVSEEEKDHDHDQPADMGDDMVYSAQQHRKAVLLDLDVNLVVNYMCFLLTRCMNRKLLESMMDIVDSIQPHAQHWKTRLLRRRPFRDLLEMGPYMYFTRLAISARRRGWRLGGANGAELFPSLFSTGSSMGSSSSPNIAGIFHQKRKQLQSQKMMSVAWLAKRTSIGARATSPKPQSPPVMQPIVDDLEQSTRTEIKGKLGRLLELEQYLVLWCGRLHHSSNKLNKLVTAKTFDANMSMPCIDEMMELLVPKDSINSNDSLGKLELLIDESKHWRARCNAYISALARPSHFQRHWPVYTLAFFGTVVASRSAYTQWPQIVNGWHLAVSSLAEFWREHISVPLHAIRNRFFYQRNGPINKDDLRREHAALKTMITEFHNSRLKNNLLKVPQGMTREQYAEQLNAFAARGDTSIVLSTYEEEVSKPIMGLATGDLLRCVFIQLQKLKVEIEASLVELEVMLDQNEITLELTAIVPAFLLFIFPPMMMVRTFMMTRQTGNSAGHRRIQMGFRRIHLLLIQNYPGKNATEIECVADSGRILLELRRILKQAKRLHRRKLMPRAQYRIILSDVSRLASLEFNVEQKRMMIREMHWTHRFLQVR